MNMSMILIDPLAEKPSTRDACLFYKLYACGYGTRDSRDPFFGDDEIVAQASKQGIDFSRVMGHIVTAVTKARRQYLYVRDGSTYDDTVLDLTPFCRACGNCGINDFLRPYGLSVDAKGV